MPAPKLPKIRTQLTIAPAVLEQAEQLMKLRAFDTFSGFVETLVREEFERRAGPLRLKRLRPRSSEPGPELQ